MADQMKPAYLIHGSDQAKIDQTRGRLRKRAEREGGVASLEVFEPVENRGSPDADALAEAMLSMSLMPGRRYLLADRVEKWGKRQAATVCEAVSAASSETTVVLIARGKVPAGIEEAVREAGGDVLGFDAPSGARLPAHLVQLASARGFELSLEAARLLVSHLGDGLTRLDNELNRLALWAGPGGSVGVDDLRQMIVDSSDTSDFALGDAIVDGDRIAALRIAERLIARGTRAGSVVYPASNSVRRAHRAVTLLESGLPPNRVERELGLPPFLARRLIEAVRGGSPERMRDASIALADLELWTRGGAEYPDDLALDLALISATDEVS